MIIQPNCSQAVKFKQWTNTAITYVLLELISQEEQDNMNPPKRLFILGLPGAGKALVARTVAKKLDWEYIDADLGLEHQIGNPITEILGDAGLECFLKTQTEILKQLNQKTKVVITTDTSVVLSAENRKLLNTEYSIYLKASVPTLIERYEHNPVPLLGSKNREILLNSLYASRDSLYTQSAQLTVDTDQDYFDQHVDRIFAEVKSL